MKLNFKTFYFVFYNLILMLIILFAFTSCKTHLSKEQSRSLFLNSDINSGNFRKGLEGYAEHLYNEQWPEKYDFRRPKIHDEKMMVEWEHKIIKKTKRSSSKIKVKTNIERLALSCLASQMGQINLDKLMRNENFKIFSNLLGEYLCDEKIDETKLQELKKIKMNIFELFGINEKVASANEVNFKTGIIITTGFYLGFPYYKRITLDNSIENREEFLRVYLHECGHQMFDRYRKFGKTLRLGLSWIGWLESTHSWWVVEEKSCNIFAEFIIDKIQNEIKQEKGFQDTLHPSNWISRKLSADFRERYSLLFYNPVSMLHNLKNQRIESRYSTNDQLAAVIRQKLREEGLKNYINSINGFCSLDEVLKFWNIKGSETKQ